MTNSKIQDLIDENKIIEVRIAVLEQIYWDNIHKLASLGDWPSIELLMRLEEPMGRA